MLRLSRLPIGQKVNVAILSTTLLALMSAGAAIIGYELSTFRRTAAKDLVALAEIVGANTAGALAFNDAEAADRILFELRGRTPVACARLFTRDHRILATFCDSTDAQAPQFPDSDRLDIGLRTIQLVHPVLFRGDRVGTIFLESRLDTVYDRLNRYALIIFIVILAILPAVFAISWWFRRVISAPIQQLADIATHVADEKNYSVRSKSAGEDEVGRLNTAFNHMLDTIEGRDKRLVSQAEELWRSNRELEQFAYISSHDLQEPLRKITSYAQLLELRYKDKGDAEVDRFVENICISAARMKTLIQDLLAYSRLNKTDEPRELVDLNTAVRQVLGTLEERIREKGVSVNVPPLPTVHGNPSQLQQLLQNLTANAIKFHEQPGGRVWFSSALDAEFATIGVHDNGIGIDPRYHGQIFKVFHRLHTRERFPGTGIGLAICKKIVEQHGGQIWVESQEGAGSSFYFTLRRDGQRPADTMERSGVESDVPPKIP